MQGTSQPRNARAGVQWATDAARNVLLRNDRPVLDSVQLVGLDARVNLDEDGIDLDRREWQVVELPLSFFHIEAPIDGVIFSGNLAGTFYLDDVRLLTAVETTRVTAIEDGETAIPAAFALDVLLWWWPDGQRVGFQSYREENWEIYAMDVDGSNIVNLTNFGANESDGSLSPDGTKIVFQSDRDGSNEIYLMNADGTDLVRLTEDTAEDTSPSWSPDGRRIVFVSNRDGNQEVYVMDADGSNPVNLTNHSFTDAGPSFSPDGTRIVSVQAEIILGPYRPTR